MILGMLLLVLLVCPPSLLFAQREIPYIPFSQLPEVDGDISDWVTMFDVPFFTQSDFLSIICPRRYVVVENGQERDFWVPWASHGTDGKRLRCSVSEEDQQVEVWVGWNRRVNLIFLAARVKDNAFGTNSSTDNPKLVWKSDDFEVFIDSDRSGSMYDSTNAHAQQYVLNPARQEAVLLTLAVVNPGLFASSPDVLSSTRRDSTEYTYEIAIPGWDTLDSLGVGVRHDFQKDDVIGLTVGFGDFDSHADADADANLYNAYSILDGRPDAYKDADAFLGFKLAGPSSDFNDNGRVDFADFFLLADAFGKPAGEVYEMFDLNMDGTVNSEDFFLWTDAWEQQELGVPK